jgi:urease gamma subunit
MSMPKGHKSRHGYATVASIEGGFGYREIAEHMSEKGIKMNHSTARNIFLSAMRKIARDACLFYDIEPTKENLKKVSSDPRFQSGIIDFLQDSNVR